MTIGLLPLSFLLAAVEHGWQKLSPARIAESLGRTASPKTIERMLAHGESAESALIFLRVGSQVMLVMGLLLVMRQMLAEATLAETALWTGALGFVWITVFCRLVPAEMGARPLLLLVRWTMPGVTLLGRVLRGPMGVLRGLVRRVTGHTEEAEAELVADEILQNVHEGRAEGLIQGDQADMIEHVLELRNTEVRKLMTPRTEIDVLNVSDDVGQAREVVHETGRSRYPLVEGGDVDRVVGIVHAKDLLKHGKDEPVTAAARDAWFVPESKHLTELLAEFKKRRAHLAVVLDEYGGTAGIVTIEDVLEAIVGEITDEFDEAEVAELQIVDDKHAVASGTMHVDELNEQLGLHLPESDDWSTVGGLIFNTLGRLPREGETVQHNGVHLRVEKVVDRRVERVAIEITETAA